MEDSATLKVLTLNARFLLDRHHAREELIKDALRGHDVVCLQEVATGGVWSGQEKRLAEAVSKDGNRHDVLVTSDVCVPSYIAQTPLVGRVFTFAFESRLGLFLRDLWHLFNDAFLEGFLSIFDGATLFHMPIFGHLVYVLLGTVWLFGNATITRKTLQPQPHSPLLVGGTYRVAQKTLLRVPLTPDGLHYRNVWVVNTHLTDTPQGSDLKQLQRCQEQRTREFLKILIWLESDENMQPEDAVIMMGDMNAQPHERLHSFVAEYGFRSAYKVAHGAEPEKTFHQNHECPTKDVTPEECIDYVFYRGPLQVTDAEIRANKPHPDDARIYPSDHFAVSATFAVL
ncbi:Glucose-repressible alcohol dehydrogenase transcriptional effector [Hondaea fermentalgiana]|uniref:Glucose-repressible alcohol dehydrogenase transcriptional effector n=1 Tax=Hondaea fermentalgiana TaxID=2315210 RepID=A0A2R5G7S3_9STRA|nr:Glucose-repressible alcohol dehydrogenase transcriptional effector [Hondaea fermentalgiana]|eukprot:GBG26595.1 Glucose-repressible alcohol dehydrogenase transcriptional effector [Hondaea fermentalgiana]